MTGGVVLFHSSASSARQWDARVGALEPRSSVHAVELYGHGEQARWPDTVPLSLADEAALAVPLLEALGGAHLVGHSYGGAIALKLASLYPRLVRSVVVYEPVLFRWLSEDERREITQVAEAMRQRLGEGDAHAAARRFIDFWAGDGAWASMPGRKQAAIAMRVDHVLWHFEALFRELLQPAELRPLGRPMLFLSGERTVGTTRCLAEHFRRSLPGARHEVLQRMGHLGPITHAYEVNRSIVAFLHANHALEPLAEPACA